jgi:ferritin
MLSATMEHELNKQLNAELYSAYLYLAMAAYFHANNLNGFANWMMVQNQEETMHAMKFYHFINERGGRVHLEAIAKPEGEWNSPLEVFEATLRHEQKVTGLINHLVDVAMAERDHATNAFLQWFITEQVEEEASAETIIQNLKLAADNPQALLMLDRELGTRVFTPPASQT